MSQSDIIASIAAGLAALSFIVSLWAAYKASKFSDYQVRLSNRAELHKILLDIDRELLHDPSLHAMFKSATGSVPASISPLDIAKQDTYAAMYLNMFELSFAQFKEIRGLSATEQEVSEAWDAFILSFFEDCIRARPTWARFRSTYYSSFRDYIDGLIAKLDAKERT
ncbi:MAG TPA: hypothetical protein VJH03_03625 [Blastocatellia bacterium]|nr:hypothetical protein [Blastocatellia bacterium]